ncbi:MAG: hypothetical protein KDA70_16725, partial [Planctomycetaceae bacterium]|nr:hypothetical protein [Planctomycetaceae bacterium]
MQILLADSSGGDALCCNRPGTIPSAAQSLDGFIRVLNYSRRAFPGHFICESDDSLPSLFTHSEHRLSTWVVLSNLFFKGTCTYYENDSTERETRLYF